MVVKIIRRFFYAWSLLIALIVATVFFGYNCINVITGNGVDQRIIFYLLTSQAGGNFLFINLQDIIIALLGLVLAFFFIIYIGKKYYVYASKWIMLAISSVLSILAIINPFSLAIWQGYEPIIDNSVAISKFTTSFQDYYYNSGLVEIPNKKNVVMISLASFEAVILDSKNYPVDVAKGLRRLRNKSVYNYNNIIETIGLDKRRFIFLSKQCGLPFFESHSLSNNDRSQIGLFNNTTCLPDIFKYNNYNIDLLNGAIYFDPAVISFLSFNFPGYFGPQTINGKLFAGLSKGDFGFFDASFFIDKVIPRYNELLAHDKPFFLNVIGVSSDGPYGDVDPKNCVNFKYKHQLLNALSCTDRAAANMIQHMIDESVAVNEDTVIMVMSDHYLRSDDKIITKSIKYKERRNLFFVIDTSVIKQENNNIVKPGSYVDLAATLLIHYLGVDIPGFGVGKNLHDQDTTTVEMMTNSANKINYNDWKKDIYKLHTSANLYSGAIKLFGGNNNEVIQIGDYILNTPLFVNCNNRFSHCMDSLQDSLITKQDSKVYIGSCMLLKSVFVLTDNLSNKICLVVTKNGQLYYKQITKHPFFYKDIFDSTNKVNWPIRDKYDISPVIDKWVEMHKIILPYVDKSSNYQFISAAVHYIRDTNNISSYAGDKSNDKNYSDSDVALFGINENGQMLKLRSAKSVLSVNKRNANKIKCQDIINKQLYQMYTTKLKIKVFILHKPHKAIFCGKKNKNDLEFLVKNTPFNTAVNRDESYIGVWVPETDYLYELKKDKTLILDILSKQK